MNDPTTTGPADSGGSAAPASIAETAANVIDQYDSAAEASGESDASAATGSIERGGVSDTAQQRLTEEEQILSEFRYKTPFKPDGREHHIPRSKVLKMLATGLKRGNDRWTGEKTTLESELGQLRDFRDGFAQALRGDERAFLQELASHDPRYARFLQEQQRREEPASDEPQPDLDLGDGRATFSKAGLQKWVDWAVRQRLAPIEAQRQQEEARAVAFQAQQQLRAQVHQQMETARQWPQWDDYATDILKKLQADSAEARSQRRRPTMTVREAYLEVKTERLSGGANDVRKKVIAELANTPKSTGLRAAGSEVPRTPQPLSIRDIASRTIDRLERQGS